MKAVQIKSYGDPQRKWKSATIRNLALEPSLGVTDDGKLAFLYESGLKVRWKENGERLFRWAFGKSWLWRGGYIQQSQTVYICEGETDAVTLVDSGLEEDGDTAVIALPGASFHIDQWAPLFSGKNVIIATDADKAGVKAAEQLVCTLGPVTASLERLELKGGRRG
jgi:5S rRNA maturation endonuclease (ribonuclease M5)